MLNMHAILAVSLTAVLIVGGCGHPDSAESFYQDALTQHQKGETRAAIIQLKNAAEKNANYAPARYLLAVLYNETGEFNAAEKEARKALALGADPVPATIEIARALLGQNQGKKLLAEIPASGGQGETLATLTALRGNAHLQIGEIALAETDFDEALKQMPANASASFGLARLALAKRDIDSALNLLTQALTKSPNDIELLMFKADILRASGKADQAATTFNEVLKLRKDYPGAYLGLGTIALDAGKLTDARVFIDKAHKTQPNNLMALYLTALVDFRQGKHIQARDNLQQVLKSAPKHLPSVVLFSAVSYAQGAYEQAEQKLSPVLESLPQNNYVRRLLAATQLKQTKFRAALETIKPLLTPQADAQTLSLAGEIYMGLREPKKATAYFEQATRAAPSAPLQARLGASLMADGEVEAGIAELEKAARMDPKLTQADSALVVTYMQLQQYDKALAAIDALEKKQPNAAHVHNLRGGAYLGKRDFPAARKNFEKALALDPTFTPAAKNLAQLDMQDKQPDAARKRLQNVLDKDKNNIAAMLALADIAAAQKQEKDYLAWIEKAAKADPKAMDPKVRLIRYYLGKKEAQKALALAREAQSANGDSPQALELLGKTQLAADEKENAIATFTKLIQIAPNVPASYFDLGAALEVAQRGGEAREALTKSLALNPDYQEARRALIGLELRQNRAAEALKLAEAQTLRQAKSPIGPGLEGDVLMAQKQYAAAAKAYSRAFNLDKSGEWAIKFHQSQLLAGNVKEADAHMLAWLKERPEDFRARMYLADSLSARKEHKAAAAHYEAALQKSPDNAQVLNNLAVSYGELKDSRALSTAERAYKLQPKHAAIQDTLGWILLAHNQTVRARELLKEAVTAAPKAAELRYHYAAALAQSGDQVKARAELDTALAEKGVFPSRAAADALRKQLGNGP